MVYMYWEKKIFSHVTRRLKVKILDLLVEYLWAHNRSALSKACDLTWILKTETTLKLKRAEVPEKVDYECNNGDKETESHHPQHMNPQSFITISSRPYLCHTRQRERKRGREKDGERKRLSEIKERYKIIKIYTLLMILWFIFENNKKWNCPEKYANPPKCISTYHYWCWANMCLCTSTYSPTSSSHSPEPSGNVQTGSWYSMK